MAFLWGVLWLLLAIVALLSIPVYLDIRLGTVTEVWVGWLFLRKQIPLEWEKEPEPEKEKPKAKPTGKKTKKKEKSEVTSQDFFYYLDLGKALFHDAKDLIKALLWQMKIRGVCLYWTVAGEDAYEVAMDYGKAQGAFWGCYAALCSLFDIKLEKIVIESDFVSGKSQLDFSCRIWIMPSRILWNLLWYGAKMAIQFFKVTRSRSSGKETKSEDKNTKEKAVECYESTSL